MQTKDYVDTYKVISALKRLTDVVIVLDDNSSRLVTKSLYPQIDILLSQTHNELFNDQRNTTLLLYMAWSQQCDWVVKMDDDILLSRAINSRQAIEETIERARKANADLVRVKLRDLWGSYATYRADGIWRHKSFPLIQRVWMGDKGISLRHPANNRLHYPCFIEGREPLTIGSPYVVYHTGCLTRKCREERVQKYKDWDENNSYQSDYSYMLNEDGLIVEDVPPEDVAEFRALGLTIDAGVI